MLKYKKIILSFAIIAILVLCFAGAAFAGDTATYSCASFSNYFYTTGTVQKDADNANTVQDYNDYFKRISDDYENTYFSYLYEGTTRASLDTMVVPSGEDDSTVLNDDYDDSDAYEYTFRLKVNNPFTVKYKVAGMYSLYY